MFTGIVAAVGRVHAIESRGGDVRLSIESGGLDLSDVLIGDSIAPVAVEHEGRHLRGRTAPRVTIVVASIEPRTLGAAMKEISGEIRTNIQEPGGCSVAAAGECCSRSGGQGSRN